MNGSSVPRFCAVLEAGSPSNECPSSEWDFMQTWMSLGENSIPDDIRKESIIFGRRAVDSSAIQLTGKTSTRQYTSTLVEFLSEKISPKIPQSSYNATSRISTTQQAGIADALTIISTIWQEVMIHDPIRHGASFHDNQKTVHTIANDYYQPYSSLVCVRDAIQGPNDERIIHAISNCA